MNQNKLFSGMSPEQIRTIKGQCSRKTFNANDFIVREGEPGDEMFILEKGVASGKVGSHAFELPDEAVFGEVSLIEGGLRTATIFARTDVMALVLNEVGLENVTLEDPFATMKLLKNIAIILSERLRGANVTIKKEKLHSRQLESAQDDQPGIWDRLAATLSFSRQ
jgi:CRP-like cAMP-binding protein